MNDYLLIISNNEFEKKCNTLSTNLDCIESSSFFKFFLAGNKSKDEITYAKDDHKLIICNSRLLDDAALGKSKNISDAQYILSEINRTNDLKQVLNSLNGVFSILAIDLIAKELIIASDHFHQRPAFFLHTKNMIVISSSIAKILESFPNETSLDKEIIMDYLVCGIPRNGRTIYTNINVVKNNHILHIDRKFNLKESQYYEFAYSPEFNDLNTATEATKNIFTEVVKKEVIKTDSSPSFCLSGGLDSSSIISVANKIVTEERLEKNILAHSFIFEGLDIEQNKKSDERAYAENVLEDIKVNSEFHKFTNNGPLDIQSILSNLTEPIIGPNIYTNIRLFEHLKKMDIQYLFDGMGGDTSISHGHGRFYELGAKLKIKTLFKEYKSFCVKKKIKFNPIYCIKNFVIFPLIPILNSFRKHKNRVNNFFDINQFLKDGHKISVDKIFYKINGYYPESINMMAKNIDYYENLTANNMFEPYANRTAREISSLYNITLIAPFNNKKIREFFLKIPLKMKMKSGIDRFYFRESMKGLVNDVVLKRNSKSDISPLFLNQMINTSSEEILKLIFDENEYFQQIFDKNRVLQYHQRLKKNKDQKYATTLYKIISLSCWIKTRVFKPK